ncbi:MAG: hypothetical protein ACE5IZ_04670 [Dehalococcoidia bacterium]
MFKFKKQPRKAEENLEARARWLHEKAVSLRAEARREAKELLWKARERSARLDAEASALERQLALDRARVDLLQRAQALEAQVSELEGQLQAAEERRADIEAKLNRVQERSAALPQEHQRAQKALTSGARGGGSLEKLRALAAELDALDRLPKELAEAEASLQQELDGVEREVTDRRRQVEYLRSEVEGRRARAAHDPLGDGMASEQAASLEARRPHPARERAAHEEARQLQEAVVEIRSRLGGEPDAAAPRRGRAPRGRRSDDGRADSNPLGRGS